MTLVHVVRTWLVIVLAALTMLTGAVSSADATTSWWEDSFEEGVPTELGDGWGWDPVSAGHVGPSLQTTMPVGQHWGASGHVDMGEIGRSGTDELFWRYWLWLDGDFYVAPPNRGKLPGPAGLYTYNCLGGRVSTPTEPCWSARTLFSRDYRGTGDPLYPDGPEGVTRLGSYVYHLDGPGNRGDIVLWDRDAAVLDHGRWYCIEGQVAMNTPGRPDGVLRAWVDGETALDRTDLRFRRSAESSIHVKSFWMDVYHGGGASAADNRVRVDSLSLGPVRQGCDDADVYEGSFRDDDTSVHQRAIEWLADEGITRGCNPPANDRFCPTDRVTRGQMAAFLVRALDLRASDADVFTDDDSSVFESAIQALAAAGVTRGCNPPANDRFCPDDRVTREQMAAFLVRAYELAPSSTDVFIDDDSSPFEAAIQSLAGAGVTRGCNPPDDDRYCPGSAVTRGQMASFLERVASG